MTSKATSSTTKPTPVKPNQETSKPDEEKTNRDEPKHLGTHPASFEMHDFERNFKPTDDPDLDEKGRWLANEFFAATGPTTVVRLDELTNLGDKSYEGRGDSSDREMARQIIMRAGLGDHFRFNQLVDMMARGLGEIDDPGDWLHGYTNAAPQRESEDSGKSGSTAG